MGAFASALCFVVVCAVSGCASEAEPDGPPAPETRNVLGTKHKPLVHTLSGWAVADELVVTLSGLSSVEVNALARSVAGDVVFRGQHTGVHVLRFADGKAVSHALKTLLSHPNVVEVGRNRVGAGTGIGTTPFTEQWNIRALNVGFEDDWGDANGVRVAILDSGIAYETYSDGSGDYVQAPNLAGVSFAPGYDFVNDDAHANDDQGHGTHIAGIIASSNGTLAVAPGAELIPVKVLDANNQGTELALAEGIYFATDNGAKVINMSLAFDPSYFPSRFMQAAIDHAVSNGVVLVAAVGNDGSSVVTYPAAFRDVIAVGATKLKDGFNPNGNDPWKNAHGKQRVTDYSNTGSLVDIVAPGGSIDEDVDGSGNPEAILAQSFAGDPTQFDYYFWAGTSQAAAHVSAIAAVMLAENSDLQPADVRALLGDSANQKGGKILNNTYGRGRVDVPAAVEAADDADATNPRPQYYVGMRVTLRKRANGTRRQSIAEVHVVDEQGNPVPNIKVHGSFTGGIYQSVRGKTKSNGIKTFRSRKFDADNSVVAFQVNAVSMTVDGEDVFDRPHGQMHIDSCSLNTLTQFASAAGIGTTPGAPPVLGLTPIAVKFDVPAKKKEIPTVTLLNFSWGLATVPMVVAVEEQFFNATFPNAADVTVISFGTGIGTTPLVIQPNLSSLPYIPAGFVQSNECVDLVVRTFSNGAGIGTTPFSPVMPAPNGNCQTMDCSSTETALQDMWLAFGTGIGTTPIHGDFPTIPVATFNALVTMMQDYADFGQYVDASPVASYGTVLNAAGLAVTPVTGGIGNGAGSVKAN